MQRVSLTINGRTQQFVVDQHLVLLDLLRNHLHLTGAKQSCDRKGQCGACTVLVNGKAVLSCLTRVVKLDGADIITVEGLGTPDNPHVIQEAFAAAGAVQCGYCTPGMIMAAKALLDRNPDPGTEEIKQALRRNLCRCTGYQKIIKAVTLAGTILRGELGLEAIRPDPAGPSIGVSHPRPSALPKACGTAAFTADIHIPGALELAVLHSPWPHAIVKRITTSAAETMPGVIGVMTSADIKGTNRLKLVVPDRPILCEDRVRSLGDPIAVVAAETREQALAALQGIEVEVEPLPVLQSPSEALAPEAVQIHPEYPNLCYSQPLIKGDAESALAASAAEVKARFITQINHQAPLEPEACVAYWEEDGEDEQLVVIGRSINIHHHLSVLQEAIGWDNLRYEEASSGGQFGIKYDITSEGIAAAAALHFHRPVRYIPSLAESMLLTSKRHSFDMQVRMGADAQGRITGLMVDITVDNGAYHSNGNFILNRALHMLAGSYHIPALKADARLVYTNNPYGSSARGAGPPQAHFALECIVDMLADSMRIDPLEFRRRNSLLPGQSKATGQVVEQWPFPQLCDAIRPAYERSRQEAVACTTGSIRRGVGLAAGAFGVGVPGDAAMVAVELNDDGGITIFAAAADPGEGNDSMLTQLAAHLMSLPLPKVRLVTRTTAQTTATGPAAASRMTYMVGGALADAITRLRQAMAQCGAEDSRGLQAARLPIRYIGRKKTLELVPLDPRTGQGPSFESDVHAIQLAEVEVNVESGDVRIIKMTTAVDAGTVINPLNLEGQLEGGMDMGAGYALREDYIAGVTKDWVTFKFPTIKTAFPMEVLIQQTPRINGPEGATGVGEMTMVPTAPAIINAINNACGVWICSLPATPEKIRAALAVRPGDAP